MNTQNSVRIDARSMWTDVCRVENGVTYQLTASGRWWDWFVPCGPDGYVGKILGPLADRKRSPQDPWFCLMGSIDQDAGRLFRIGSSKRWTATAGGMLSCFANDMPAMYWNNWGAVTLHLSQADKIDGPTG